ncbi:cytochrome P450 [Corallococcus sp. H22C18031201]|nr:cytochrome P450 [Corallococcus sp. H22C18031201]
MFPADPITAVTHPDPYPYYRHLAATRAFHWDTTLGLWVAAGPDAVAEVLRHPACRVRPPGQPVPPGLLNTAAGALFGRLVRMNDGPAHARIKGLLAAWLDAVDLFAARRHALALTSRLPYDAPWAGNSVDAWMRTVPVLTMGKLLGLPVDTSLDDDSIAAQVATYAAAQSPLASGEATARGAHAAQALMNWAELPVPDDRPLSALRQAAATFGIAPEAVTANAVGLLVQTCEATAGLAGNTLLRLAREDGAASDIGVSEDEPLDHVSDEALDRIQAWVARVAREDPSLQNTRRFIAQDTTLCGAQVAAGDGVLVLLAAAGTMRPDVEGRPWTFGAGVHACPGHGLAQALASATVTSLLARGVRPAALARRFAYRPSVNARMPRFG